MGLFRFTDPKDGDKKLLMNTDGDGNFTSVQECEDCLTDCQPPLTHECIETLCGGPGVTDRAAQVAVTFSLAPRYDWAAGKAASCSYYQAPTTYYNTECYISGTYVLDFYPGGSFFNVCTWRILDVPFDAQCMTPPNWYPPTDGTMDISLKLQGVVSDPTQPDWSLILSVASNPAPSSLTYGAGLSSSLNPPEQLPKYPPGIDCTDFSYTLWSDWLNGGVPPAYPGGQQCIGDATVTTL